MNKIRTTGHFHYRIKTRIRITSYNAGKEVHYAIKYGKVLYSNHVQSYKILGYRGVYILSNRLAFVTAYRNHNHVEDQHKYGYKKIKGWRLRMLKRKFYINK